MMGDDDVDDVGDDVLSCPGSYYCFSPATENQFADVFTKAPTAPMLRLLKTLMDGAARVPLLARLYQ